MVDPKQGQNKADRCHSFTGIRSKIQLIVLFVELKEVHRRMNKMMRDEEAVLGDVT